MFSSPFFRRLFLSNFLLACVAAGLVGVVAAERLSIIQTRSAEASLRDETRLIAQLVAGDLQPDRSPQLQAQVESLGNVINRRITVIAADGKVLADNEADPEAMDNHAMREEIIGAASLGESSTIRRSDTVVDRLMYFARREQLVDGRVFYVRLALHLRDLETNRWSLYRAIAAGAGVSILGAAAISFHLARRHARPLVELTEFADALCRGELDRRAIVRSPGEIAALAAALNAMAQSLGDLVRRTGQDRARLAAILSSMSEGVVATDAEQRVLLHNSAAGTLFNAESASMTGRYLWEVIRCDPVLHAATHVLAGAQTQHMEVGPVAGRYLNVAVRTFSARSDDAAPEGLVIVAHDVTESVSYQNLRKELVANVSHELRTPLTAIKGYTETLLDGAMSDPQRARQFLRTIEKHADQLTNLVNDLLELSRLESRHGLPQVAPVDIGETVGKAVELLSAVAAKRKQHISVLIDPNLPTVPGSADYLERAVANLLENAIKYSPEGGTIRIAASLRGDHVAIELADTGIGIPAADLSRIFERFYRVDQSRSRDMGGTGLGLSIVKHIAQAHRGSVEVKSAPGKGSTFTLNLPVQSSS